MKKENTLQSFFNLDDFSKWKKEWVDMPEFVHEDLTPIKQLIVSFATKEDFEEFSKLIGQKLTSKTQSVWYPEATIDRYANKIYINES